MIEAQSLKTEHAECVNEIRKQKRGGMPPRWLALAHFPSMMHESHRGASLKEKSTTRAATDSSLGHTHALQSHIILRTRYHTTCVHRNTAAYN